jgi:predicted molibdopterin-dependent oxidoreductase YjgC
MLDAARDGKLGALAIFGANPVLRFPDRALVEAALEAVPFVVVSELFMTETAERANLILPACSAFEKSGTTTDLAGDVLPVMGSVVAPGEAQADGDMLVLLAEALGVSLPDPGRNRTRDCRSGSRKRRAMPDRCRPPRLPVPTRRRTPPRCRVSDL